jgi:hypothetical protein
MNVYDFWNALVRITDGAGLRKVPVSLFYLKHTNIVLMVSPSRATRNCAMSSECSGISAWQNVAEEDTAILGLQERNRVNSH